MFKFVNRVLGACGALVSSLAQTTRKIALCVVGGASALLVTSQSVMAQTVTLPDTGCDVAGHVTAAITALGAVVMVVIGGYFAYLIVRKALKWSGKIA